MFEIIALSTAIFFTANGIPVDGISREITCMAVQRVVLYRLTRAGAKCAKEIAAYPYWDRVNKETLSNMEAMWFCKHDCPTAPPTCDPERIVFWRRLVGMCDDGLVRWKEIGAKEKP